MPSHGNKVIHLVVANGAQSLHEGFRLVQMAHPVVTSVHDTHRDLFQPINMVENVVVVAIRLAASLA
jgi:hypothetical protein